MVNPLRQLPILDNPHAKVVYGSSESDEEE